MPMNKKSILHIITNLGPGGAPKYLLRLIENDDLNNHYIYVIDKKNTIVKDDNKNYHIFYSKFNKIFFPLPHAIELIFVIFKIKPSIIQTWLYHADFLSILIKIFYRKSIIWSIRNSIYDVTVLKKPTLIILKICSLFSKLVPNRILYNSMSGRLSHENYGYHKNNGQVIVNGINISSNLKKYHNFKDVFRIGTACRNDPAKGLEHMLLALDNLNFDHWTWTLIGDGCSNLYIKNNKDKIFLKEFSKNIENFYSDIDLFVLPSLSEGLSNVLLEAMSRGITCIATDVGDNYQIIQDGEKIISPGDHQELAQKINECFSSFRKDPIQFKTQNKIEHINSKYNYQNSVKDYQYLWNSLK